MAITYELCSNDEDMESAYKVIMDSFTDESVTFHPTKSEFIEFYKNSEILLAKDGDKVVGCVVFFTDSNKVLRCPGAAVLSDYRQQHIFTGMLNYGHNGPGRIFRAKGATRVLVFVEHHRKESAEGGYLKDRNLVWCGLKNLRGKIFNMYYRDLND